MSNALDLEALRPSRREMLRRCGAGLGAIGLAQLLGDETPARAAAPGLAPRAPHFAPKAKRFVHIFANGGPSQVDMFDPKPLLKKLHGKPIPREFIPRAHDAQASRSPAFASPWGFRRHGKSGIDVCELLPHLAGVVD